MAGIVRSLHIPTVLAIFRQDFQGEMNFFFPLSSCTKDIKSHLQQLKVAQTSVGSE